MQLSLVDARVKARTVESTGNLGVLQQRVANKIPEHEKFIKFYQVLLSNFVESPLSYRSKPGTFSLLFCRLAAKY